MASSARPSIAAWRFLIPTAARRVGQTMIVQLIKSLVCAPGPNMPEPEPLP